MQPQLLQPAFETARLRVFCAELTPTDHNTPRLVYLAFRTDEDRPLVCATLVLFPLGAMGATVAWIEVASEYRRQGFGLELFEGVAKHCDEPILYDAGSDDGKKFCAALESKGF